MRESKGEQILDELKADISAGRYGAAGAPFVTMRELCGRYDVALKTAFRIMSRLHQDGIIEKSGRGYCIAGKLPEMRRNGRPLLLGFLATCLESPYFAKLATHAEELAHSIGASLIIASSNYDFETERERLGMFCEQGVAGVLVCPWASNAEQESFYRTLPVPYVLLGRRLESFECDAVLVNNQKAAYEMGGHLLEGGPEEFAYIGLRGKKYDNRLNGFRSRLLEAGVTLDDRNVLWLEYGDRDGCRKAMTELLSRRRKGRLAVFCYHDLFALRLNNVCHELGLDVPGDVMVAGFDDLPSASESWPPLTSVSYPVKGMVQLAFESLYTRIRFGGKQEGFARYLDSELVIRKSTTP
ncbi:MAG: substrate-binding domain-containing protein [Victivallales bacterium]|nr:substrate-binding domain-containing protein [Victivallales bacterium]